ncbi:hypothetical protein ABZ250_33380 [Streptomyces afghaniensis]|uniref:Mu transposase domain-containing protein n=1 Tax=Streptomyces afghaniensis TaxID=66865 RepID=UPI0033A42F57
MVDEWDQGDEGRRLRGRTRTVGDYFAQEQHQLRPLPTEPFETGRWFTPWVSRISQISVRGNAYSVPVRFVGRQLTVLLHANYLDLIVYDGRTVVTRHERLSGRHGSRLVLDHYLEALLRKPGAFPGSTALEQARSAGRFTPVHDKWWTAAKAAHGDAAGTRALIEVLARHMDHEQVVAGLAAAHRAGALTADAVALEARKLAESNGEPTPLARTGAEQATEDEGPTASVTFLADWRLSHLPPDTRPLPSVAHYDQLLQLPGRTAGEKEGS